MGVMVFCASTPAAVRSFASTGTHPVADRGFAATEELRTSFGYGLEEDESADYAAQLLASLQCLVDGGDRLVLAVELDRLPESATEGAELGRLAALELQWPRLRAIFCDAPEARGTVRAAAESSQGKEIEELWEDQGVRDLLTHHDLLWFADSEWEQALEGLREPDLNPGKDS